ncbi:hypothetical protein ES708_22983 [subsurface metagenome]
MKQTIACLWLITCLFITVSCTQTSPYYRYESRLKELKEPPALMVLLTKYRGVKEVSLDVNDPYQIFPYTPDRQAHFISSPALLASSSQHVPVRVRYGQLLIGNRRINASDVVLVPNSKDTLITLNSRSYRGYLRIKVIPDNKLLLGNIIGLEDYLYGVIGSEMDTRYPAMALSVQAVSSRTLALFRIKRRRIKLQQPDYTPQLEDEFDLTDDVFSQVYRGEERVNKKSLKVVQDTQGVILAYQGRIFESLFHDTCGGHTEPAHLVWGGTGVAPLNGTKCGFCGHSRFSHWTATYSEEEIIKKLKLKTRSIDQIESLKNGPGGHIMSIGLETPAKLIKMNAQRFRIALDPNRLRSTLFNVRKNGSSFEFTGQGWGHAVGMCQEGAHGLARQKATTLRILEYYFPRARVVKIY